MHKNLAKFLWESPAFYLGTHSSSPLPKDRSGNNNHGTVQGKLAYKAGINRRAASFNGANTVITSTLPKVNKTYSVSMFAKFNSNNRVENMLFYLTRKGAKDRTGYLSTYPVGKKTWHFGSRRYGKGWEDRGTSIKDPKGLLDNKWHHLVFVLNDKNISLYVNGQLLKTITSTHNSDIEKNGNLSFFIGGSSEKYQWMDGLIDEVKVYNRTLSKEEVVRLGKNSVIKPNLVVNGSFEKPKLGEGWKALDSIPGWTASKGHIEVQHGVAGKPRQGKQLVELDAHNSSAIYQDIVTKVNETYKLIFHLSPRPGTTADDNKLQVMWDGNVVDTFDAGAGGKETVWKRYEYIVNASKTKTRLEFQDVGKSNGLGTYIDKVVVKKVQLNFVSCKIPKTLDVGQILECDLQGKKRVKLLKVSVGCNDGETGNYTVLFNNWSRQSFEAKCNSTITLKPRMAREMLLFMQKGGGPDNHISIQEFGAWVTEK
ncbi:DUF642 domain-containing protein [Candidatus Halobeggiatoa sp. HSG11]|nr:DUF642 domain-containing protein [Candidatus Halobeggiatoa sp. HSG11]